MNDEEERYVDVLNQVPPEPIQLINNDQDQVEGGWAKDVQIAEYNVIEGSTRAGAYVVWVINIETWNGGGNIKICKRYSEFVTFREMLIREFPNRANEIPQLPPKSIISRFQSKFLQQRKQGLQYFLLCVLLNPTFASSSVVRKFVRA